MSVLIRPSGPGRPGSVGQLGGKFAGRKMPERPPFLPSFSHQVRNYIWLRESEANL